jgi:hypothetical protein
MYISSVKIINFTSTRKRSIDNYCFHFIQEVKQIILCCMSFLLFTAVVSDGKTTWYIPDRSFYPLCTFIWPYGLPGTRSEQEDGNSGNRDIVL